MDIVASSDGIEESAQSRSHTCAYYARVFSTHELMAVYFQVVGHLSHNALGRHSAGLTLHPGLIKMMFPSLRDAMSRRGYARHVIHAPVDDVSYPTTMSVPSGYKYLNSPLRLKFSQQIQDTKDGAVRYKDSRLSRCLR